jgi:hypothetical protein
MELAPPSAPLTTCSQSRQWRYLRRDQRDGGGCQQLSRGTRGFFRRRRGCCFLTVFGCSCFFSVFSVSSYPPCNLTEMTVSSTCAFKVERHGLPHLSRPSNTNKTVWASRSNQPRGLGFAPLALAGPGLIWPAYRFGKTESSRAPVVKLQRKVMAVSTTVSYIVVEVH